MIMQITVIEIILSSPWRWTRGICWEIIEWCLFSTQIRGSRAASASRRRVWCSSRLVPVLPLPLPTWHQGRDRLQRFKSISHSLPSPQYDFSIMAVCPFLFASSFVRHSIRSKASRHVIGCRLGVTVRMKTRLAAVQYPERCRMCRSVPGTLSPTGYILVAD